MGDRLMWSELSARQAFIAKLSAADYEYLREYLVEHKIPPGTLPVNDLKCILEDCKGAKKVAKGVKDGH